MPPFPDYPIPPDEEQRLRDLQRHGVLDTAPDPHFDRIVQLASEVLGMPVALVSLVDRDRQWFLARHGLEAQETPRQMAFCAHAIAGDRVLVVPDALADERFNTNPLVLGDPHIRFYAGAPLRSPEGHNLGTLCVVDQKPRQLGAEQLEMLELMADLVMRELELRRLTSLCPVTGLYNRSSFFRLGEQELQQARRDGVPLALLNFDIDDFRQINNRWGHQAGDRVLQDVCRLAQGRLRPQDLFGRIGDEEFAVLLVGLENGAALALAETIRGDVEAMAGVFSRSDYHPQISGGLTTLAAGDRSFADVFYRADQALYLAKGNGRNQIAKLLAE
ncbi:MAG: sensor domain-containing diguanylate cyclase [Synechococcaceae bacterium WB8_1B_136]|nr:sensor domain-containing diguanylate cyclase [Synechococcaceae bacterium WB8_1B_136]